MDIFHELQWRGLLEDYTGRTDGGTTEDGLPSRLRTGPVTLYCGFDPTADSLHVGSLVPLLALRRFQLAGHHPVAVAGGATGSIGDPSGKTQERQLLTKDQIGANVQAIRPQLARLLDFEAEKNPARLVDNADWLVTSRAQKASVPLDSAFRIFTIPALRPPSSTSSASEPMIPSP